MLLTAPSVAPGLRRVRSAAARVRTRTGGPVGRFRTWRSRRPFVGGVLAVLAGVEMFFSGQLDFGNIHVQMGISGFQATVIPAMLVLLGVLAIATPAQRLFSGILTLVIAVYSLVGVNLGGFFVGMLLAAAGGVAIVTWRPRAVATGSARSDDDAATAALPATATAARPVDTAAATLVDTATTPAGRAPAQWIDTRHLRDEHPRAVATGSPSGATGKGRP